MFAQVDDEVNRFQLLSKIIDHRRDDSEIKQQDTFVITKTCTKRHRRKTKGQKILFEQKDSRTSQVQLKELKASYHVQAKISEEPAFAW